MKLYTFFRSSAAYRVRIALNVKGIAYESIPTHLRLGRVHRSAEYAEMNPQRLVPTLVEDGFAIPQSLAILEYLEERHPTPAILPISAPARAQVRALALHIACEIHPLNNLRVLEYLRTPLGQTEETVNRWYQHWVAEGLSGLEAQAARLSTSSRYLCGDAMSIADICLLPQMYQARRFKCDLKAFPTLKSITSHLETLTSFIEAAPERQADAEV